MQQLTPKADTVYAFLRLKGWELVEKTKGYYIMTFPPEYGDPDFKLWLPRWENEPHYKLIIFDIVGDIARDNHWDKDDLISLLSKEPNELDKFMQNAIRHEQEAVPSEKMPTKAAQKGKAGSLEQPPAKPVQKQKAASPKNEPALAA
ncbi:MAG: hypothetical protein AAB316_15110 [Bacteroidota bacterium]